MKKGLLNQRTAKERYTLYKRLTILVLVCTLLFAAVVVMEIINGEPISASSSLFIGVSVIYLSLFTINLNKAKAEVELEEGKANVEKKEIEE